MTPAECRDATVAFLRSRGEYVPIGELAAWMKRQLHLSRQQGDADLRALLREGRIVRRATRPEAPLFKAYEYAAAAS